MVDERLRIGDAEREQAARALGEHFAQGRIDNSEHDERLSTIWGAKTAAEIKPVFEDLPGPRPGFLAPPQAGPGPFGFPGMPRVPQAPVPYHQQLPLAPPERQPEAGGNWWWTLVLVLAVIGVASAFKAPVLVILAVVLWMMFSRKRRRPRPKGRHPGPYPPYGPGRQGWH